MNILALNTRLCLIVFSIAFAVFWCLSLVQADPPWEQTHKLLPSDGFLGDWFGSPIVLSGNTALIGAPFDDDDGTDSGSAYAFDITTGQELFKVTASDGASQDHFGRSLAMSGDRFLVGSPFNDALGKDSGSVYVFKSAGGRQLYKLVPSDVAVSDNFGMAVALSDNLAVIGSVGDDDNGALSGSAYVFDIFTRQQIFKLLASDGMEGDQFGNPIAVSGQIAVIGAPSSDEFGLNSGAAYVFDISTGEQLFKLVASDEAAYDEFGAAISISGNTAVITSFADNDNGERSGSAYVFDLSTGQQLFKLLASDGAAGDVFGNSVSLSGNLAIIGAKSDDDNGVDSGSVYLFDISTGEQLTKMRAPDGAPSDLFGASVALSGTTAVAGSIWDDDNRMNSGSAYVLEPQTTNYLSVDPFPLIAGQNGIFSIVQALPQERTWLLYSINGLGQTFIPPLNVTIDLNKPKIAFGPQLTDANGNLQLVLLIPHNAIVNSIWFQTVQRENVTNFFQTQIVR